jgi:hypothetical protein
MLNAGRCIYQFKVLPKPQTQKPVGNVLERKK